jgi:hypothetical protein
MSLSAVATLPTLPQRGRDIQQVIQGLRRQNPRASKSVLAEQLADELLDDRPLLLAVTSDLVHKALAPVKVKAKSPTLKSAETARRQRAAHRETETKVVKVAAEKLKEQVLLDLVMPNGIAMRFCTGTQMAGFGTAYQAIAAKAGDAMVGEVLVESEIKALLSNV